MLEEDLKVSRLHTAKFLREIQKLREGDEEKVDTQEESLECTINTFGFGSSHNSDLLEKLAERFDGMYYFIKDSDAINEGFATCLGGLMSTVATNLQLKVTPLNGAENIEVLGDFVCNTQQGTVSANLGDIQSEEKRHILFEVDLPDVKVESDADSYCSVKLSYENTISKKTDVLHSLLELKRGKTTGKRDDIVDEQYNRVIVAQTLENVDRLGRAGQLEQARASLDRAMTTVLTSRSSCRQMSRNLISDMTETKKGYSSMREWQNWGNQSTNVNRLCYRRERSVRLSSHSGLFRTQSTYANVSKINTVSQFNNSCSDDSDSADDLYLKPLTRSTSLISKKVPKSVAPKPRSSIFSRPLVRAGSFRRSRLCKTASAPQETPDVNSEDLKKMKKDDFKKMLSNITKKSKPLPPLSHFFKPKSPQSSQVKAAKPVKPSPPKRSSEGAESLKIQDTDTKQNEEIKDLMIL